jgi:hypothetical protein
VFFFDSNNSRKVGVNISTFVSLQSRKHQDAKAASTKSASRDNHKSEHK